MFIGYGVLGIATWTPWTPSEFLSIAVRALLAAGLIGSLAMVVLPAGAFIYRHTIAKCVAQTKRWAQKQEWLKAEKRAEKEAEQKRLAIVHRPLPPPPPPPPTREELIQRATDKYEANVRLAGSFEDEMTRIAAIAQADISLREEIRRLMQ